MGRSPRSRPEAEPDYGLGIGLKGDPPLHDWRPTGRRFKDHAGMEYEVFQCARCATVAKRYGRSHHLSFSGGGCTGKERMRVPDYPRGRRRRAR